MGYAPPGGGERAERKRNNPLSELIGTESLYVGELNMVIRRVAAAWNPTNFPPAELDGMFRAIEEDHGSVERFATRGLGLDPRTLGRLRAALLDRPAEPEPA